jgi:uncharacterized protein (TIGR03437 family)
MVWIRLCIFLTSAFAATLLEAGTCSVGIPFNTANVLSPFNSDSKLLVFARSQDLPYLTSVVSLSAPYTASLPANNGNQLLEGCFAANPPLVNLPLSYQSGVGAQRGAAIHSADNISIGFAQLYFATENSMQVLKVNQNLSISSQTYTFGGGLSAVLSADFNGDGKPDLAVVDAGNPGGSPPSPSALWILINNGDTTFKTPVQYSLAGGGLSLAAGDFNGDGKIDLAAPVPGGVVIFLGNGDGTFRNAASYPAAAAPLGIAVADINGDGVADVVITDGSNGAVGAGSVGALLGNPNGTFQAYSTLLTGLNPGYIAIGDFNNDGHADLAFTNFGDGSVSVALGNGGGAFAAPQTYVASAMAGYLVVTDVNQDGHVDLVVGSGSPEAIVPDVNSEQIAVLMNNGDGTFQGTPSYSFGPRSQQIAIADFDGDGILDVAGADAIGTTFTVQYGLGGGKFGQPSTFMGGGGPSVATADFNGDGLPDLLLGGTTLALSQPGRTFQTSTINLRGPAQFAVTGDFNGDGNADAAVALGDPTSGSTLNEIAVLPGNGHGAFGTPVITNGVSGRFMAAADLNKDGKLDLAVANTPVNTSQGDTTPGLTILLGTGNGSFTTSTTLLTSYAVEAVTIADVNGDGIPDLVTPMSDVNFNFFIGVALGKGDGTFKTPVVFATEFGATAVAVTDLNADGVPDLVVAHDCGMTFLIGNGDGTFQPERSFAGGTSPYYVLAADMTGDGKSDLVISNYQDATLSVALHLTPVTSITNVSAASFLQEPLAPESIATAFGAELASGAASPTSLPLPTDLNGTVVTVTDSAGKARQSPLFFVSPAQVNYEIPAGTATGIAQVVIASPKGKSSASVEIASFAPAFFQMNAAGLAAGSALLVSADGKQTPENIFEVEGGNVVASPINLGTAGEQCYLTLYATGVRNASSLAAVAVIIGGVSAPVKYAGPQGAFVGLDQVNVLIPSSLAGMGQVDVLMSVDGVDSPPVVITIQ